MLTLVLLCALAFVLDPVPGLDLDSTLPARRPLA
jgi:hypothetical protein